MHNLTIEIVMQFNDKGMCYKPLLLASLLLLLVLLPLY